MLITWSVPHTIVNQKGRALKAFNGVEVRKLLVILHLNISNTRLKICFYANIAAHHSECFLLSNLPALTCHHSHFQMSKDFTEHQFSKTDFF